jgi:predicted permease
LGTAVSFSSARASVRILLSTPGIDPLNIPVAPDFRVFGYALFLVLFAAFASGLAPALQATRPNLSVALKEGAEGSGTRNRMQSTLVGFQVAVSMVLLMTAGLLLRGLTHARNADPGFSLDHATTMTFDLRAEGYSPARAVAFHRRLDAWLPTIPGMIASTQATAAPLAGRHYFGIFGPPGTGATHQMQYNRVGMGFFASIGLPVVRGRDFTATDLDGQYVIVSESAARTLWPGEDPIGKLIHGEHNYTVVGVARDAQVSELGRAHEPFLYLSSSETDALELGTVIVRSTAPDATVAAAVRAAALSEDRDLHLKVAPLRDNIRSYIDASRILASLSSVLGGLALLLASIGIYGTVAFSVARRTREIGIRVALGATGRNVIEMVGRQALRPVTIGAAIGLLVCLLVTRVLETVLFGVSALDATAFVAVTLVLFTVALVATYFPARHALRVDPLIALRAE